MIHPLLACAQPGAFPPDLYAHLRSADNCSVNVTGLADIGVLLANLIQILLSLAGALAVVFVIIGGIMYALSAGDPSKVTRAKSIIVNAVTGIIIITIAFGAVNFIAGAFN